MYNKIKNERGYKMNNLVKNIIWLWGVISITSLIASTDINEPAASPPSSKTFSYTPGYVPATEPEVQQRAIVERSGERRILKYDPQRKMYYYEKVNDEVRDRSSSTESSKSQ